MYLPRGSRCALRSSSTVGDMSMNDQNIAEKSTTGLTREKKYPVQIWQASEALRLVLAKGFAPSDVSTLRYTGVN